MSDDFSLRTTGPAAGESTTPAGGLRGAAGAPQLNELAELLADLLSATGLIPEDKLALARGRAGQSGSLAQALVDEGIATSEGIARTFAARYQLPLVDLAVTGIDPEATKAVPLHVLERVVAIPYGIDSETLRVAIADPGNVQGIDEIRLATRLAVEIGVAPREDIEIEVRRLVRTSEAFGARAAVDEDEFLQEEEEEGDDLEAEDGFSDAPLVRLVNSVIFQAAEDGASDIHFEPQEDTLIVRLRIDGVLHEVQRIPKRLAAGVTTRLKVLAKLDIAERRKPQDGRIALNAAAAGRQMDIRVAVLPTVEGEQVVMRLVDKSKKVPTLAELGLNEEMQVKLQEIFHRPTGALLVTGPTGSGKSTSLYAGITEINRPEINIITVEDPVEFRIPGINQVQINQRAGLTFATALRSILRSDPDVVMVGEIRDGETAKMAIEAALTGHFVLSTLHTNDAPQTLTRMVDMGVKPYAIATSVSLIIAQRLARRLCTSCKQPLDVPREALLREGFSEAQISTTGFKIYKHVGCHQCTDGYKGRVGIYEVLPVTEAIGRIILEGGSAPHIAAEARKAGVWDLRTAGLKKVLDGLTTLEEVNRVTVE